MTVSEIDPRLVAARAGSGGALRGLLAPPGPGRARQPARRPRAGRGVDLLPVSNSNFLSSGNLTNLMLQIAAFGTISVGVVLVLLLGEIDLSVGSVSGLAAGDHGGAQREGAAGRRLQAIAAGLVVGAGIGLLQGLWVTKLRVPSFVVTLAGLLAWQGALLHVLGEHRVRSTSPTTTITDLAGTFFSDAVGWIAGGRGDRRHRACGVVLRRRRPDAAGPAVGVPLRDDVRHGWRSSRSARSWPWPCSTTTGACRWPCASSSASWSFFDVLTRRTVFGRHVFAVGGNAEAARRAGIRVDRVRTVVFVLASTMAAAGRHPRRLPPAGGQPVLGQRRPAAQLDRRRGDRRHVAVRRAGLGLVGAARRPGHRVDRQRHGPARPGVRREVHGHRRRAAGGRHHRRRVPPGPPGGGPGLRSRRWRVPAGAGRTSRLRRPATRGSGPRFGS